MSNINIINALKSCILFQKFNEESLNSLLSDPYCSIRHYSKEEVVFFQMDKCEHLSVVIDGTIEIQQNNEN
ncbi:MAG: Crp/Fnr family transcriptional regulator, partial [Clostridium baratii]|nr:Crp/Fnr family transcriptional regulator [Clostridium baratii]